MGLILIFPFSLLSILQKTRIKYTFLVYLLIGLLVLGALILLLAWWAHQSDLILLKHYGYNIEGMSEAEYYGNVLPENIEKVEELEISIMGIGWPLKAILGLTMTVPFLLFVYVLKISTKHISSQS